MSALPEPLFHLTEEIYFRPSQSPTNTISSVKYVLRSPRNVFDDESLPLCLFLHGSSARGDSFEDMKSFALPKLLSSETFIMYNFPMYFIFPLCPRGIEWKSLSMCSILLSLIEHLCLTQRIDKTRVYCTGISMGGLGCWMLGARSPSTFAALAPICGGGSPVFCRLLRSVPIHFFHSADDNVVSVNDTDKLVAELRREGSDCVLYTRYDTSPDPAAKKWMVGHNCWDKAYSSAAFWSWLLEQTILKRDVLVT